MDAYLRTSAASLFQLPIWQQLIRGTYGHPCDYWVARRNEEVVGAFPVTVMRFPGLGSKMVATPYQFWAGLPLGVDPDVQKELASVAAGRAREAGARYLEVRHHGAAPFLEALGFERLESQLAITTVPLESLELGQIRRNHRRCLRAAEGAGLVVEEGGSLDDLRTFRHIHLVEARSLGAPQVGWRFFELLHRVAREHYRLYLARVEGTAVGGLLCLQDDRTVYARLGAYASERAMSVHAGHALYWRAIQDGKESGRLEYNCGISWTGDTGLIHWKEGWQGTTRSVELYVLPIRGRPTSPGRYLGRMGIAKRIWRRLPLPVAARIGHLVTTWVG